MLEIIQQKLLHYLGEVKGVSLTVSDRLERAQSVFNQQSFSRKEYLVIFKTMSTATASRDLKYGCEKALLHKSGDKNNSKYEFQLND